MRPDCDSMRFYIGNMKAYYTRMGRFTAFMEFLNPIIVLFGIFTHFYQVITYSYYYESFRVLSIIILILPFVFFYFMIKAQPKVKTMHLGHRFLYILLLSTNLTQTQNNKTFDVHRGVDHVV